MRTVRYRSHQLPTATSEHKIETAREAAELLGLSLSQFNEQRLAATYKYDLRTQQLLRLPPRDELPEGQTLRELIEGRHLAAPTLTGQRRPWGSWRFNLTRLQELREEEWPGAVYSEPRI